MPVVEVGNCDEQPACGNGQDPAPGHPQPDRGEQHYGPYQNAVGHRISGQGCQGDASRKPGGDRGVACGRGRPPHSTQGEQGCGGEAVHQGELNLEGENKIHPLLYGKDTGCDHRGQEYALRAILTVRAPGKAPQYEPRQRLETEGANQQEPSPGVKDQVIDGEQHFGYDEAMVDVLTEEPGRTIVVGDIGNPAIPIVADGDCNPAETDNIDGAQQYPESQRNQIGRA